MKLFTRKIEELAQANWELLALHTEVLETLG